MIDSETRERIFELRRLNVSIRDIGDLVGVPKSTIFDILKREVTDSLKKNILVVGDLHFPFMLPEYKNFCYMVYKKYRCDHVIFIGDLIDNHAASYHETDPDGLGGKDELGSAKKMLAEWYRLFPVADVVLGNHDRIIMRKAFSGGIPVEWLRDYCDVLGVPNWTFKKDFYYDDVLYRHGVNAISSTNVLSDGCSIVQGHAHSECRLRWKVGKGDKVFGMQVPTGIDDDAYAFQYNESRKSAVGCAVVLGGGKLPIIEMMNL